MRIGGASEVCDFLVIGGGIIGIATALELKRRFSDCAVTVIEKEARCGLHASGRNSGVLHAGFYYTADSLKARFTREGNRELTEFCLERGLPLNRCGKLVVARDESELAGLDELLRRGRANGVTLECLSAEEARRIEPRVKTFERALFSPNTSTVDPKAVLEALLRDAASLGVAIRTGVEYRGRWDGGVITSGGKLSAGYVVNAAGLYADRVALDFGFSEQYRILPFKGVYLYADPGESLRVHVYPVPDLRNPFLGVHFTVTVDGRVKIGPTAIPAFWREHYRGWENFKLRESLEILRREAGLFLRNDFGFRRLALSEIRKYFRQHLVRLASELVEGVDQRRYRHWGESGIRAQLLDLKARKLEMDFRLEGDDRSFHVLNAVSPAFTCAFPFSRYVVDRIAGLLNGPAVT
ncbi:MAG: aminobutyraldehyde dehydrogenase [Gemmatimonadales bacterium]|nr:MAG: aminobutyraldehyde dehydrogenase [Gemmatimonadales bacterium]